MEILLKCNVVRGFLQVETTKSCHFNFVAS
jgi:hypothetical protein